MAKKKNKKNHRSWTEAQGIRRHTINLTFGMKKKNFWFVCLSTYHRQVMGSSNKELSPQIRILTKVIETRFLRKMHNSGQQIKRITVPSIKPNWFPKIYIELCMPPRTDSVSCCCGTMRCSFLNDVLLLRKVKYLVQCSSLHWP